MCSRLRWASTQLCVSDTATMSAEVASPRRVRKAMRRVPRGLVPCSDMALRGAEQAPCRTKQGRERRHAERPAVSRSCRRATPMTRHPPRRTPSRGVPPGTILASIATAPAFPMSRDRRLALVAVLALAWGCVTPHGPSPDAADNGGHPVALVTTGSAFARPGLQEAAARAVAQATGRRVVRLDPASAEASHRRIAERLARARGAVAGYDWRDGRCKADAAAAIAVDYEVDAVYRL